LTGLDYSVLQIKTKIVSCHTAISKPVKQEINGTVILPPLVFPAPTREYLLHRLMPVVLLVLLVPSEKMAVKAGTSTHHLPAL
jgi:hypothetical protein